MTRGCAFRLGYNTNGFAHHRLEDAIHILAALGYRAVALTPDAHHLPPDATTPADLHALRQLLESLDLAVVVETGARYVLDPRRKHRPNLLEASAEGRSRRLAFLVRCAELVATLGGDTVSIWSGACPPETSIEDAWRFLEDGVGRLCDAVAPLGVRVAFEPEPGMLAETLADWDALHAAVSAPNLGLALDVGHVPCTEPVSAEAAVRRYAGALYTVHLDDSRGGMHEHLQIGEGELEWPAIMRALCESGFAGIASVELSRHSHAAPVAARDAIIQLSGHLDAVTCTPIP